MRAATRTGATGARRRASGPAVAATRAAPAARAQGRIPDRRAVVRTAPASSRLLRRLPSTVGGAAPTMRGASGVEAVTAGGAAGTAPPARRLELDARSG